jgi:hypothetical protein
MVYDPTEKRCIGCGAVFVAKAPKTKFCSISCYRDTVRERPKVKCVCETCKVEFIVKDHPERGRRFCGVKCAKTGAENPNYKGKHALRGDKHHMWKGDAVGIDALHVYIRRRLPKPDKCQECHEAKPYDLANISNEYKRDVSDWEWLCRRCHMKKDGRLLNLKTLVSKEK